MPPDSSRLAQFAEKRGDHGHVKNAGGALRVGNFERLPRHPGRAPAVLTMPAPQRKTTMPSMRGVKPGRMPLQRQPGAAHRGASTTATAIKRSSFFSGAISIVGVFRYQWPRNMAAIVLPSSKPAESGSSRQRIFAVAAELLRCATGTSLIEPCADQRHHGHDVQAGSSRQAVFS